ncbi:AI-2E family transporter [Escherichia coli]
MPVLIPAIIWLYWTGDTTWGTVLLVWSGVVGTLDNVIPPMLIRMGADLPLILILSGVIGGLIAFGMIGLFIGPVLLARFLASVCRVGGRSPAADGPTRRNSSKNLAKSRNRISNFSSGGSAA